MARKCFIYISTVANISAKNNYQTLANTLQKLKRMSPRPSKVKTFPTFSSQNKAEHQDVELNWIERLLLFPYCLSDCSDMIESPLELFENYDEKEIKLGTETTEVDPGLDSPEELCAETLEAVEAVEENIKSVFESNDPVEDVLAFILTSIIDYAQLGWEFISRVVNTGTKIK